MKLRSIYAKRIVRTTIGRSFIVKTLSEVTRYYGAANNHKTKISREFDRTRKVYKITIVSRGQKTGKPNWDVDINNLPIPESAYSHRPAMGSLAV